MATTREGGARRGKSSSNPPQPKKAPLPKPSSSSQKPLPNYLKPTISSSLDFSSSRTSRRSNDTSASTSTTTTTPNRRRSYDKPPSPAHLHASTATTTRTHPSSTKPVPERSFLSLSSRSTKVAPAGPVMRRSYSAKASPTNSSTSSLNRVARKAGPRSVTSESSVEFEGRHRDPLHQEEKLAEALETEIKESKNEDAIIVAEEGEVEQEAAPYEKEELPVVIEEERSIDRSNGEEAACQKEELPVVTEEERSIDKSEEEIGTEDGVNQGKGEQENDMKEDLNKVDEKLVVVELKESAQGSKVGEEMSVQVVQVKTESPTIVKANGHSKSTEVEQVKIESRPAKQMQPGKKEKQAYNDVIEETAGKLMERRNRVRALAGAFETVISLQDTK